MIQGMSVKGFGGGGQGAAPNGRRMRDLNRDQADRRSISQVRPGISRDGVARDVSTAGRDCSAMEGIGGVGIFGRGGERRLPKRPDLPIGHGGSSLLFEGRRLLRTLRPVRSLPNVNGVSARGGPYHTNGGGSCPWI